jgi:hypothetical protein
LAIRPCPAGAKPAQTEASREFLHVEILAGVDHRFRHHVLEARLPDEVDDLPALLDAGGHRHGTADVLAGFESGNGLPAVVRDGRIDVDQVNVRVLEHLAEIGVALFDLEGVANGVELRARALADRVHVRLRVTLVDRDEFGSEAEADDGHVHLLVGFFRFGWHGVLR